jgi:phosphatidylglycerol:prolipoprotein diacylglycerol transferase
MYPVLFEIGDFKIYSYGVMLTLAFIGGIILSTYNAKAYKINKNIIINLACWIIISALIGAKLLYILLDWKYFLKNPKVLFQRAGFVLYGGLISATLVGVVYLKKKTKSWERVWRIGDIIAPSLALGESITRIGCFLYGCCYGKPCDFIVAIKFPACAPFGNIPVHPTQIYTLIACFFIFLYLFYHLRRKPYAGKIFFLYILLHSIQRSLIDNLRGDLQIIWLNLTFTQIIAIFLAIFSLFMLKILKK